MKNNRVTNFVLTLVLVCVLSVVAIAPSSSSVAKECLSESRNAPVHTCPNDFVYPIIYHRDRIDNDCDGVQDYLESTISQMTANQDTVVRVVVTLYNPVSSQDLEWFAMVGGEVTYIYRYVSYGFAGTIPATNIPAFVRLEKENLCIVEYDASLRCHLDISVPLIRVRPTVWDTYGYMGSPNHSIAVLDTGIDDSHSDIGSYQDLNFSQKMVGWYDATPDGTTSPHDYGEHGTHVAGIAAGIGTMNLQGSGQINTTFTYVLPPENPIPWRVNGYVDYIDVMVPGVVKLNCSWGGSNDVLLVLSNPAGEVDRASGTSQPLTITYNTSGTLYPTGRYQVFVGNVDGPQGTPFSCVATYPYQGPNDGHDLFTGVAPDATLVGVKVFDSSGHGNTSWLLNGMDWIIENKEEYHIVVASISIGLYDSVTGAPVTDSTMDQKVDTMVKNGIVTTVSAGNDYPNYDYMGSFGTAAYAITVGATNDENGITGYSSNGDSLKNEFGLIKPDVVAPGGTFDPAYGNKILSADSNDADAPYSGYADRNMDDYQQMAGTSMATPHVAGLAALTIQALGEWNWTEEEALKVKMLISMTGFETQSGEGTNVPSLDRGDKDSKEGYGRVCADAAIEAATITYTIGELASDAFGADPSDKKVWARQVSLYADKEYEFNLTMPSGADYDLYLYNGTSDDYGQPVILGKSADSGVGANETIQYIATNSGTHYIVVKWVSGDGSFSLRSSTEHDVEVVGVAASMLEAYAGNVVNITVSVENNGGMAEDVDVIAYYNDSAIETLAIASLAADATVELTFNWNTSEVIPGVNYTIWAEASLVEGEANVTNNIFVDGEVHVKLPGDVDGDGDVDGFDLTRMCGAYGALSGTPNWDEACDITRDGVIDGFDLTPAAGNYGKTY